MQRRLGQRVRTDVRVRAKELVFTRECRAIEVSTTGVILDRGKKVSPKDMTVFMTLQIQLPDRPEGVKAVARPVWSFNTQQAVHLVEIDDVDRLSIAEHMDAVMRQRRIKELS
jgi:hypothetical protein